MSMARIVKALAGAVALSGSGHAPQVHEKPAADIGLSALLPPVPWVWAGTGPFLDRMGHVDSARAVDGHTVARSIPDDATITRWGQECPTLSDGNPALRLLTTHGETADRRAIRSRAEVELRHIVGETRRILKESGLESPKYTPLAVCEAITTALKQNGYEESGDPNPVPAQDAFVYGLVGHKLTSRDGSVIYLATAHEVCPSCDLELWGVFSKPPQGSDQAPLAHIVISWREFPGGAREQKYFETFGSMRGFRDWLRNAALKGVNDAHGHPLTLPQNGLYLDPQEVVETVGPILNHAGGVGPLFITPIPLEKLFPITNKAPAPKGADD